MTEILVTYRDVFLVLHTISFAIGLGAATVHDVAFTHYLSAFDKERWNSLAYKICFQLIRTSLFWAGLSGLALFWPDMRALSASPLFQFKMLLICLIALNSYFFHHRVIPKLMHSFWYDSSPDIIRQKQARNLHRLSFALGAISLSSWYSAASLGGLRTLELSFPVLLGVYVAIIALSIGSSFFAEARLAVRLERTSKAILKEVATELLEETATKSTPSSGFWAAYRSRFNKLTQENSSYAAEKSIQQ